DRSAALGLDPPPGGEYATGMLAGRPIAKSSRAAATGDFDGDGRVDLVVANFNERPYLYMNRTRPRNWVGFRLVGTGGNRDAIGAVVRVKVGARTMTRQVDAAGGYLAQSSLTEIVGLGGAGGIDGGGV